MHLKKRYIVILSVVLILIVARITLSFWVTKYVNKVLSDIPGYSGSISNIDLHLYRGAYVIDSLQLFKTDGTVKTPLFSSKKIDLSIQWKALFKGAIEGEIYFKQPVINLVGDKDSTNTQYGEDVDWTKPIKDLMPVTINHMVIENGEVHFRNFTSEPKVDVFLKNLQLDITNMNNVTNPEDKLPSSIVGSAISIGNGNLVIQGNMNLLKEIPDMDIDVSFEGVDMVALNDFLRAYAKLDAESGEFNLYSEVVIDDAQITGYVKPIMRDLTILSWKNDKENFLQLIWESIAGFVIEISENQKKDQFATKLEFEGDLKNPDTKIFPAIWNVYRNAFVDAFKMQTDDSIDYSKLEKKLEKDKKKKDKKEKND